MSQNRVGCYFQRGRMRREDGRMTVRMKDQMKDLEEECNISC